MHPHESIIRTQVENQGSERERQEVDDHLKDCDDCKDFVSFVQDFSDTAKGMADDEIAADEPHPSTSTIIDYEEGTLDKETSLHVRAHMLYCDRCAESYYLLQRMREPGLIEVVIDVVQRAAGIAKEFLLKPIEINGPGELVPSPALVRRGSDKPEEGQSRLQIVQHVTDSGDEADLYYSLEPEATEATPTFLLRIDINPPNNEWRAEFFDSEGKQLASVPLSLKSQIIYSHFPEGTFTAKVDKADETLAECRLEIRASR